MRKIYLFLLAAISLASCKQKTSMSPLFVHTWELYELSDTTFSVPEGTIYVQLDAKGAANGNGGCNTFSGNYTADKDATTIHFSNLVSTLLWCDYGELETKFMNMLQQANKCRIYNTNNDLMALYHDSTFLGTLRVMQ